MSDDQPIRILFVEDVPADAELAERALRKEGLGFTSARVETRDAFLAALTTFQPDLIISDYTLPEFDGLQALQLSLKHDPALPVILMTGSLNEETAVACIKAGATDYVLKDRIVRLPFAVKEALAQQQTRLARAAAEQALRETEDRYRDLVENSQDLICTHDLDGKLLSVNEAAVRFTGYSRVDLLQMNMPDLLIPQARPLFSAYLRKMRTTGHARGLLHIQTASGESRIWEYANTLRTEGLAVPVVRGIARDVTERKRAEEAHRRAEKHFKALIENAPDGIVSVAIDGAFKYSSPSARRIFGYSADEAVNTSPIESTHPDDLPTVLTALNNLIQDPMQVSTLQYRFRHRDGSWRWIESTFSNLLAEPGVEAIVINFRDITERRRAEYNLELLAQAGRELGMALNLRYIYTTLHRLIRQAMPCAFLFVSNFSADDQLIRCVYGSAPQGELDVKAFPPIPLEAEGRGTQSLVIRSGEPLLLNDYTAYLRTTNTTFYVTEDGELETDNAAEVADQPRSALIVPMKLEGRVVGVIQAQSMHPNDYAPRDLQFLESLALHVSRVLANAQLFDQVHKELAERKQAEQALKLRESYLTAILENQPGLVWLKDADSRFLAVNQAFADSCGKALSAGLAGLTDWDIWPSELAEKYRADDARIIQNRIPQVVEELIVDRGNTTWFETFKAPVFDNQGDVIGTTGYSRDITERKRAEEALRTSESRLRHITDNMLDVIGLADLEGVYEYVSPSVKTVLGYDPQAIVGKTMFDHVHPDDLFRVIRVSMRALRAAKTGRMEMRYWHAAGYYVWLEVTGTPAWSSDGRIIGAVMSARDITERKRGEEALRQRVTELEVLYENGLALRQLLSPREIGQKIIDLLAEKLAWHHTTIRLYHPHGETLELLAFHQGDLKSEAEYRAAQERFKTLVARPGDGFSGWVIQHGQIVRSGDIVTDPRYKETAPGLHSGLYVPLKVGDRVFGVISVESEQPNAFSAADEQLTATLATQAAGALENARLFGEIRQRLAEMEALHTISAALRAAPSYAEMLPVIVHLSFNVLKAASAALAMREPTTDETIIVYGQGGWADNTGRRFPPGTGVSGYVIATGRTYTSNDAEHDPRITLPHRMDDLRSIVAAPLIAQEQIVGALVVGRDTGFSDDEARLLVAIADIAANALQRATVLETLEQRVADRTRELAAANERLQELDRLKSKFVSDVSHELRTPVTSLSLYVDLLNHGKPEKREFYVAQLEHQMARLRTMINDILDLARLERDQDEVSLTPIDLNAIVEHVVAAQQAAAEAARLQLTCEVAEQMPLVLARPEQLSRAVTNLVANAIKYTQAGSVQVTTINDGVRAGVQVSDTGIGIAPEDLLHVFDRFYRGKQVAQSTIPGTGLGLAIVKEIIEVHGGTVEVESTLGLGSIFRLWLPAIIG